MSPMIKNSEMMLRKQVKLVILGVIISVTIAIHYGWLTEWLFGHLHWIHALHSRFCYIPIVIAASWFGLRGGVFSATAITALLVPYLFSSVSNGADLTLELVEVFFYYAIGLLIGALVDREIRARQKHEKMQLQLERGQRLSLLGQMAAGVAHEIKNPLASIKGALEILGDKTVSKLDQDEFREIGFKEVKRIDSTISEFLEFARPKETKRQILNLSASLETSLKQLQPQVAKSGMQLQTSIDRGVYVLGDQEKLHQAVLNLLLNAIEASPAGAAISVNLARNNFKEIVLTIADSGKGMTPAELNQAFDPFYTTKTSGTGLGLAMVKSIIEAHDGRIEMFSEPNKGTQVVVTMPGTEEQVWE